MSIIQVVVPIEDDEEPWQQIFITRPLTDDEFAAVTAIDSDADVDGNDTDGAFDQWLNVNLDPRIAEYLNTLN